MEILFIPKHLSDELMNVPLSNIISTELDEIKSDLRQIDNTYSIKNVNIGEGADWIMLLAVLNGITTVFLLGDKIDKGIEGWIKIGNRLKKILLRSDRVYFDKEAAGLIAVEYLAGKHHLKSLKLVMESELPIKDLSGMLHDRESKDFIAKPYSVYFMTFEVNEHLLLSLSVRSDGVVNEHYTFDMNTYLPPF